MRPLKILGISGSLRAQSFNTAALNAAKELLGEDDLANVELEIADISSIPVFNQDAMATPPASVKILAQQIMEADAILFSTPEYNYSLPGGLKNAIDWVSRQNPQPFSDKPAAIMSASMGFLGGARVQYDLRKIMVFLNVHFINQPEVMIAQAHTRFDEKGSLTDDATRQIIKKQLSALVAWTKRLQAGLQRPN